MVKCKIFSSREVLALEAMINTYLEQENISCTNIIGIHQSINESLVIITIFFKVYD